MAPDGLNCSRHTVSVYTAINTYINRTWLSRAVKLHHTDQFKQEWLTAVDEHINCGNYRIYKTIFVVEKYLVHLPLNISYVQILSLEPKTFIYRIYLYILSNQV